MFNGFTPAQKIAVLITDLRVLLHDKKDINSPECQSLICELGDLILEVDQTNPVYQEIIKEILECQNMR